MLIARLAVAVPLLAAVLAMVWWGPPWLWQSATFVAALLAAREWARLAGLAALSAAAYTALAGVFMLGGQYVLDGNVGAADAMFGWVCFFWAIVAPFSILFCMRWRRLLFSASGLLIIFAAWYAAAVLFVNDLYALLAVMALVWTADSAAYLVGRRWGKTKMAPQISPGKTWEGFWGGMTACLALTYFVGTRLFLMPSLVWLLTATFVVVALAAVGDLFESSLKRQRGVKDSGVILGSHGGVLDRLDAMLPALPFAALISSWLA